MVTKNILSKTFMIIFGISLSLGIFSLFAENIFFFERIFQFRISKTLDPRVLSKNEIQATYKDDIFESYGLDPIFYRRTPGSTHRSVFDSRQKIEVQVDEVGYLNPVGYYTNHPAIDVFVSGDSTIQGVGMTGVVEEVKFLVPYSIFSLSIGGYGPRQKVQALLMFGRPKNPKVLVIEFLSQNDASDAIVDDVCGNADFRCHFAPGILPCAMSQMWKYRFVGDFEKACGEFQPKSLTVALGYRLLRILRSPHPTTRITKLDGEAVAYPGGVSSEYDQYNLRRKAWVSLGLNATLAAYDILPSREVILLYNPTSYEIYRGVSLRDIEADRISDLQRRTLQEYATRRGWSFCDMTPGFRQSGVRGLFGVYDSVHWSQKGRGIAARVIMGCLQRGLK